MERKLQSNLKIKFSLLQVLFWCTYGSFTSFAITFFIDNGLTATEVGICASVFALGSFAGQMTFSQISDRLKTNKKTYLAGNILVILMYWVLFFVPKEAAFVIILFGFLGFVQSPMISNIDTWILKTFHETPHVYGPIRSWASLVYAFYMLFYGGIIAKNGYWIMLLSSGVFAIATLIVGLSTPDAPQNMNKHEKVSIKPLLKNKGFLFVLFIAFALGTASAPFMQMIGVIIKKVGGTLQHQGTALFVSAIFQVPCMMLAPKLSTLSTSKRIGVASLSYLISMLVIGFAISPSWVIIGGIFNGIAFGIGLPTLRQAIFENSPTNLHTTAQGLGEAFHSAIAATVSSLLSGVVIDNYGVKEFMIGCAVVQFLLISLLISKKYIKKLTT